MTPASLLAGNITNNANNINNEEDTFNNLLTDRLFQIVNSIKDPQHRLLDPDQIRINRAQVRLTTPWRKFRRIDNAPYSVNRIKRSAKRIANKKNKIKVTLHAKVPSGLGISNSKVRWSIRTIGGKKTFSKRGRNTYVSLDPGKKYRVRLSVGDFTISKRISTRLNRNKTQRINIPVNLGVMNVTADFGGHGINQPIRWDIYNNKGLKIATASGRKIKRIVKDGTYKVVASIGRNIKRKTTIRVKSGQTRAKKINLPSATVKLSATKNKQFIMKKTKWKLYHVKHGRMKQVASTHKHTAKITVAPGSYRAVVKIGNKTRSRLFKVDAGQLKKVTIAMDG